MQERIKQISKNIFPGFVVSLIALPLSLGLALASGAPPISGVIAAVVGGVIVSIFGGSHVTVTGPGNGLVVATLTAIVALGGGDLYAGYLFTLGAIIVSGALIFLMGLLRFGNLSDFFPSAAIRGMLSAIGLIIMAKQLHVMLGVMAPDADAPAHLYAELPRTIMAVFNQEVPLLAYLIGIISLLVMILYPKIRIRAFHFIPAPMWIVLISIGLTYFSRANPDALDPLAENYLISIPDNFISELAFPDFGKVWTGDFWVAVLSLTLIAVIESLLSIKGIDKLDPLRRRSNMNKDLRALGLASMLSGAVGGLNVVSVIARSSVNVNNGAVSRSSNFFQGMFLLIFVLVFAHQIQHIPLPALAAILVFTGYKLAEPKVFIQVARVGWEQLVIFLVTMITTLVTNLITGIAIGILVTLVFQLRVLSRIRLFVRYTFRPNTIMYREEGGQYHLSIKAYSNFLNFIGMRKKLDSIPSNAQVIIDFSLAEYVDHSVLEHLEDYLQSFRDAGGDLEIIGLDDLGSSTSHPLAPRLPTAQISRVKTGLSRRQKGLRLFAQKLEWRFSEKEFYYFDEFRNFEFFSTRRIDKARNLVTGTEGDIEIIMADLDYHEGEFIARESRHSTMVIIKLPESIAKFVMDKEKLLDKVAHLAGFSDINFAKHPDFSNTFSLKGMNRQGIMHFFDDDIIEFFQSNKTYHVESNGNALLIFEKERVAILREIKQLVSFASRLATVLDRKYQEKC